MLPFQYGHPDCAHVAVVQMALAAVLSTLHVAKYDTEGVKTIVRDHGPTNIVVMTCRMHSCDATGNGELKWIHRRGQAGGSRGRGHFQQAWWKEESSRMTAAPKPNGDRPSTSRMGGSIYSRAVAGPSSYTKARTALCCEVEHINETQDGTRMIDTFR